MTEEQAAAFASLRALARPHRYRVTADAEGWPVIPGRLGAVEFHCDGVDCRACPIPGPLLAVFTTRPRLHARLSAIPGLVRWQVGDTEFRSVFPPEALEAVAGVIRARRRARRPMTPERLARLTEGRRQKALRAPMSATSRSQEPAGAALAGSTARGSPDGRSSSPATSPRTRTCAILPRVWDAAPRPADSVLRPVPGGAEPGAPGRGPGRPGPGGAAAPGSGPGESGATKRVLTEGTNVKYT